MLGLDVIEVMTPSGHPSIINKIKLKSRTSSCGGTENPGGGSINVVGISCPPPD